MSESKSDYIYIIESFGEEKILKRFVFLKEKVSEYLTQVSKIQSIDKEEHFFVNDSLIEEAVIDYFADLHRLKQFHQIEKAQPQKVAAYTAYWIFRRKPIQLIKNPSDEILLSFPNIKYINEVFAYTLLMSLVFDNSKPIAGDFDKFNLFQELLIYNFSYRILNSQILELVILALNADPNRVLLKEIEDINTQ